MYTCQNKHKLIINTIAFGILFSPKIPFLFHPVLRLNLQNVVPQVSLSGPERVVLRDVQRIMSGRYVCEVSTDAPDFLTKLVSANMNIVRK